MDAFFVRSRAPFPGWEWVIPGYDHLGRRAPALDVHSAGAFYDDHNYPGQTAEQAAAAAAERYLAKQH